MKRAEKKLLALALSFALAAGMFSSSPVLATKKASMSKKLSVTVGKTKTLKVKNAKKIVKWKIISGKKNISIKTKGKSSAVITGKKKGTAKVSATIGKTKLTCSVTVKRAAQKNPTPKPEKMPPLPMGAVITPAGGYEENIGGAFSPNSATFPPIQSSMSTQNTEQTLSPSQAPTQSAEQTPPLSSQAPTQGSEQTLPLIVIPDGIKSIEYETFESCSSLINVSIPESVTSIGREAFSGCSSLINITIPERVTNIERRAFSGCSSLANMTIPKNLTDIGGWAFYNTPWLQTQDLNGFKVVNGILLESGENNSGYVIIPGGVTSIGNSAFYECNALTGVSIPKSVTRIGTGAFDECTALTDVSIPESVTSIGWSAFSDCDSLTSIVIPDSVIEIGDSAFASCDKLKDVTILNSNALRHISRDTFSETPWLENLKQNNFAIYEGILLSHGTVDSGDIVIPANVTHIADGAFQNCNDITSVKIPEGVKHIGARAFGKCSDLTSVTIPVSIETIGEKAFCGLDLWLSSIKTVYYTGTETQWNNLFKDIDFISVFDSSPIIYFNTQTD